MQIQKIYNFNQVFMKQSQNTELKKMLDAVAHNLKHWESTQGCKQTSSYHVRKQKKHIQGTHDKIKLTKFGHTGFSYDILAHMGFYHILMPEFAHRCTTRLLPMKPINFWLNCQAQPQLNFNSISTSIEAESCLNPKFSSHPPTQPPEKVVLFQQYLSCY